MDNERDYDWAGVISVVPERWNLGTFCQFGCAGDGMPLGKATARDVMRFIGKGPEGLYFRPCGDSPAISKLFGDTKVTGELLLRLLRVLHQFSCSEVETFMQMDCAVNGFGFGLDGVTFDLVESLNMSVYLGSNIQEARRKAAFSLRRMYPRDVKTNLEESPDAVPLADIDAVLDSENWTIHEVQIGDQAGLVVSPICLAPIE